MIRGDYGEVEIILRYVIGIEEKYIAEFITIAKTKTAEEAVIIFNTTYKNVITLPTQIVLKN